MDKELGVTSLAALAVCAPKDSTPSQGLEEDHRFWIEVREPRCIPELKGPFKGKLAPVLREFLDAGPTAYLTVLTWGSMGPSVQDGPEALQMADGRSMARGCRHIHSSYEAHRSALSSFAQSENTDTASAEGGSEVNSISQIKGDRE